MPTPQAAAAATGTPPSAASSDDVAAAVVEAPEDLEEQVRALGRALQRWELAHPDKTMMSPEDQAATAKMEGAYRALLGIFYASVNRHPHSPFNAFEYSKTLARNSAVVAADNSVLWTVQSVRDCPAAVTALLNSQYLARVQLPQDAAFDLVAAQIREQIAPPLELPFHDSAADRPAFLSWHADKCCIEVVGLASAPYFHHLDLRRRLGAAGCLTLTSQDIHHRLLDIDPAEAMKCTTIKVRYSRAAKVYRHLQRLQIEGDLLENKEKEWWRVGGDELPVKAEHLRDKIVEHAKMYVVELYSVRPDATAGPAKVYLGVRDGDCAVVGVPVSDDVARARSLIQDALCNEMARVFPAPPLELVLDFTAVDTSSCWESVLGHDGSVVFVSEPKVIRAVAAVASWVLLARVGAELGAVFGASAAVQVQRFPNGCFQLTATAVPGPVVQSDCVRLVQKDAIEVVPHVVVTLKILPTADATPASTSLFRSGAFRFSAVFQLGRNGEPPCGTAFSLSPFATWAFLRHGYPHPFLDPIWLRLRNSQVKTRLVAADNLAGFLPASVREHCQPDLHIRASDALEPVLVVWLAADAEILERSLQAVSVKCSLILIDVDPVRLQTSVRLVLDYKLAEIADVALIRSWELLGRNSSSGAAAAVAVSAGDAGLPSVGRLLPAPSLGAAAAAAKPASATALPPVQSSEGHKLIRAYLCGNQPLPSRGDYVAYGTAVRRQESGIVEELCRHLLPRTPIRHVRAHAVLRGAGTTTLLQRVAMLLRQHPATAAIVMDRGHGALEDALSCLPPATQRVVVLADTPASSAEKTGQRLASRLHELQRRRPDLAGAVMTVFFHDLGDQLPVRELILDPLLDELERESFVTLYTSFFPSSAVSLQELAGVHGQVFVGLPGLTVAFGRGNNCRSTIESLLKKYDPTRSYLALYLARLALLELFASGRDGMPGYLRGPPLDSTKVWSWLLEGSSFSYRLRALVYAVPLLELTVEIFVQVKPSAPGGFEMIVRGKRLFSSLMLEALLELAMSGQSLRPYLIHWRKAGERSQLPRWMQILNELEGAEASLTLLEFLIKNWPEDRPEDSTDELQGSWTQAHVLIVQLLCEKRRWQDAIWRANMMVARVGNSRSRSVLIARTSRGECISKAAAASFRLREEDIDACVDDFTAVIGQSQLPNDFNPRRALLAAIKRVEARVETERSFMNTKSPAAQLYHYLFHLASSPGAAVQLADRNSAGTAEQEALGDADVDEELQAFELQDDQQSTFAVDEKVLHEGVASPPRPRFPSVPVNPTGHQLTEADLSAILQGF